MDEKTFTVIEYSSGFAIRHNATGREHWLSDGVDVLFDSEDRAISPGTPGFAELWTDGMNKEAETVLEVYFPDLVETEEG